MPVIIDQDDRDRDEYTLGLQGAYEIGHDHNVFLRARSIVRDYDKLQKFTGFDRSSDGFEVGAGAVPDFGGVTQGRFFAGYRKQNYSDPLPDISEPVFDISLIWNPSVLTSLELDVQRDFGETTAFLYSGYVSTSARVKIDHELVTGCLN